ncbi:hypothetical protein [Nocardia niwae]|uniref:Uncharacterized protein n=2 Tax=Nocardia niwae TaxID=626084 RepID=A0ABV2XKK9_9NOCA
MAQLRHRIDEMTDDSGFLGLVDPHAYTAFVGENWTLERLFERVESEMRQRTMLLWGTGGEERWRIDLSDSPVDPRLPIIRQIAGPITVTRGELVVVNLDTVTMAAQFGLCRGRRQGYIRVQYRTPKRRLHLHHQSTHRSRGGSDT